jgi:CHASE3 domain sensor protein
MAKRGPAIAALSALCGILIVLFLVRLYLVERTRVNLLEVTTGQLLDDIDSSQDAHLALKDAEAAERAYLVTHDPADRNRYLRLVQSWKDEIGVLDLTSEHQAFAPQARKFAKAGAEILNQLDAAMSSAGTTTRLDSRGAVIARTDVFDKLAAEAHTAEDRELRRYTRRFETASGQFRRRLFLGASLLFLLVILEALCIRAMSRSDASGRS